MDPKAFFAIMGTLPTGVTIVTTLDEQGEPRGFTASALCSVSADPPMLLVCIDRRSRTLDAIRASGRFVVNFLRGDRAEVSRRFASSGEDRFATTAWRPSRNGMPHLYRDALAHADCRTDQVVEAGDHVIVVAAVTDGHPPPSDARPLMYFRQQYQAWPGGTADGQRRRSAGTGPACPSPTDGVARVVDTPARVLIMRRAVELKAKSKLQRPCREARA